MNPKNRLFFFSLVAVVTLLVNLALPINAFADDATPPPAATEEPAQPPTDPIATEAPVQPPTDPVATEAPIAPPTEAAIQESASVEEDATVAEVLDQVPDGTQIVVLNEQGETLPLASDEAADTIVNGDPIWCPDTQLTPTPGANGCTGSFNKFNGSSGLLKFLKDNSATYNGAGIIYVQDTYSTAGEGTQILIDGTLYALTDLIIDGGWQDLGGGVFTKTSGTTSTFHKNLSIINWNGDITLNDLIFSNVSGNDGLTISTTNPLDGSADIELNNVQALNNDGYGAGITNNSDTGSTTINDSTFNRNALDGAHVSSYGDIILNNITADRNDGDGAYLNNCNCIGNSKITLTGINEFNANGDDGLDVYSNGDISFDVTSNTNANRNGVHGIYLYNAYGGTAMITLNNITANFNNDGNGVFAYAAGDVTVNNGYFKGNTRRGVYAQSDSGNIDVSISQFINNDMSGLRAEAYNYNNDDHGNITLDNIYSEKNGIHGANLGAAGDITITDDSEFINNDESGLHIMGLLGDLTVSESLFSGNDRHGLDAEYVDGDVNIDGSVFTFNKRNGVNLPDVSGSINITGSDFLNNKHDGAYLYNCGCIISDITIDSSNFNDNGWSGLEAYSYGEISLTNVMADRNLDGDGAYLDNTYGSGDIFVDPSEFNNNSNYGLHIFTNGNIDLSQVTASGNGYGGVYLSTGGNAKICDSTFESNGVGNQNPSDAYGVNAANVAGTLTLGNNIFNANTPGDYSYSGPVSDCNSSSGGGGGKKGTQTGSIIPVTGGQEVTCDVAATSTTLELPNGDQVTLPCPINDFAFVNPIVEDGLPGSFAGGNHFLSALNANVIRDSQTVQSLEEPMIVSFIIPDGIKADGLAIMLWDGTQWVKLDGKVSTDGLHFEVITKSTGTFALVNK